MDNAKFDINITYATKEQTYECYTINNDESPDETVADIIKESGFEIFETINNVKTWTWIPYHRVYEIVTTMPIAQI